VNLDAISPDPTVSGLKAFSTGSLEIFFTPVQIAFGWDEWQIKGAKVYLEFFNEKGEPHPDNPQFQIWYDNLNIYFKKDRQRLILPFTYNGGIFIAGGPYQPTGTSNLMDAIQKSLKN